MKTLKHLLVVQLGKAISSNGLANGQNTNATFLIDINIILPAL